MKNAQAAQHFASQPADGEVRIFFINEDTALMQEESLSFITSDDLKNIDDADEEAVGHVGVFVSW